MKELPAIYPFQRVGALTLYGWKRGGLGDEMGMFKTSQAIAVNNLVRRDHPEEARAVVVCPPSVIPHWRREINTWTYPEGQRAVVIGTSSFERDIELANEADWTILGWPTLSYVSNERLKRMERAGWGHLILDEIHNAKNANALRSQTAYTLAEKTPWLTMLSGTPIANTVGDLYAELSIMDPDNFPWRKDGAAAMLQAYRSDPRVVKHHFWDRFLIRKAKDYLGEAIPELQHELRKIPLEGDALAVYEAVLEQELPIGQKLMQLQKTLLDPSLVEQGLLPEYLRNRKIVSPKYEELDRIAEENNDSKILVFTDMKVGVTGQLAKRYRHLGAIIIDGDVVSGNGADSPREKARKRFQTDPDTRMLITTTTMNEGVDLSAADIVVNLTVPKTPAEKVQRLARARRMGEVKKDTVTAYTILTTLPDYYGRDSVDAAWWKMLEDKENIIEWMRQGYELNIDQLTMLREPQKVRRIRGATFSSGKLNQVVLQYYVRWRSRGTKAVRKFLDKHPNEAAAIAEMYLSFDMSKRAADTYTGIIKELEEAEGELKNPVDLAGGPGTLGRALGRPTVCIDIDPAMLEKGRQIAPQNEYREGSMSSIPLEDSCSKVVVNALAFQMAEPKRERAKVLREIGRVLEDNGYAILVLPPNYLQESENGRFYEAAEAAGLQPVARYTGKLNNLDVYTFRKIGTARKGKYDLTFAEDSKARAVKR